ncbi:hypothetical protein D5086_005050 [Populus alba]
MQQQQQQSGAITSSGGVDKSEEEKLRRCLIQFRHKRQLKDSRMALHSNWWLVKIIFHRINIVCPDSHTWSNR